jgi:hypothetical protein
MEQRKRYNVRQLIESQDAFVVHTVYAYNAQKATSAVEQIAGAGGNRITAYRATAPHGASELAHKSPQAFDMLRELDKDRLASVALDALATNFMEFSEGCREPTDEELVFILRDLLEDK